MYSMKYITKSLAPGAILLQRVAMVSEETLGERVNLKVQRPISTGVNFIKYCK